MLTRDPSLWRREWLSWSPCRPCARMWSSMRSNQSGCQRGNSNWTLLIPANVSTTALGLRDQMAFAICSNLRDSKFFVNYDYVNMMVLCFSCNTNNIGMSCQWTIVNFVGASQYELQHIRADDWNCVPCCKVEGSNVCLCSVASSSDDSFLTCQREVLSRYPIRD